MAEASSKDKDANKTKPARGFLSDLDVDLYVVREEIMRVYFITCHQSDEYVLDLMSYIYRDKDFFIFHCDPKSPMPLKELLRAFACNYSNVSLLKARPYSWAGYSQVRATLDAMHHALEQQHSWTHFVTLSEAHLPTMTPESIDSLLAGRGSLVGVRSVKSMGSEEKADISSRYDVKYKELRGVGSFLNGLSNEEQFDIEDLYHGSNWYILSHKHCEFISQKNINGSFKRFESAVHADENAIQTILYSPEGLAIDVCENADTTFVAVPQITDNSHLIMIDANFWDAAERQIPFIRKRGSKISADIQKFLGAPRALDISIRTEWLATRRDEDRRLKLRQSMSLRIEHYLKNKKVIIRYFEGFPFFYMRISFADESFYSVNLLSEDLVDFKVLLAKKHDFKGFFLPYRAFDCEIALIRARVHDLFFQKEIASVRLPRYGFITVEDEHDFLTLLNLINLQLDVMKNLASSAPI